MFTHKTSIPLISIGGTWLEASGFITGREVCIKVEEYGKLTISLITGEEGDLQDKNLYVLGHDDQYIKYVIGG